MPRVSSLPSAPSAPPAALAAFLKHSREQHHQQHDNFWQIEYEQEDEKQTQQAADSELSSGAAAAAESATAAVSSDEEEQQQHSTAPRTHKSAHRGTGSSSSTAPVESAAQQRARAALKAAAAAVRRDHLTVSDTAANFYESHHMGPIIADMYECLRSINIAHAMQHMPFSITTESNSKTAGKQQGNGNSVSVAAAAAADKAASDGEDGNSDGGSEQKREPMKLHRRLLRRHTKAAPVREAPLKLCDVLLPHTVLYRNGTAECWYFSSVQQRDDPVTVLTVSAMKRDIAEQGKAKKGSAAGNAMDSSHAREDDRRKEGSQAGGHSGDATDPDYSRYEGTAITLPNTALTSNIKRKFPHHITDEAILHTFLHSKEAKKVTEWGKFRDMDIVAVFHEQERNKVPIYLDRASLPNFVKRVVKEQRLNGVLQSFIAPESKHNSMFRVEWSPHSSHIDMRINPHALDNAVIPLRNRVRTYEEDHVAGVGGNAEGHDGVSEHEVMDFEFGHKLIGYAWLIVDHIRLALQKSSNSNSRLPAKVVLYFKKSASGKLYFLFCDEILFSVSSHRRDSSFGNGQMDVQAKALNEQQWLQYKQLYLDGGANRYEMVARMDLERETLINDLEQQERTVAKAQLHQHKKQRQQLEAANNALQEDDGSSSASATCCYCHGDADPRILVPFQSIFDYRSFIAFQHSKQPNSEILHNSMLYFHPDLTLAECKRTLLNSAFMNQLITLCMKCSDAMSNAAEGIPASKHESMLQQIEALRIKFLQLSKKRASCSSALHRRDGGV